MAEYTTDEKRKAALRELGQRRHVYPKLVASGRMTQAEADYQIAVMDAIRADYEAIAVKERLI